MLAKIYSVAVNGLEAQAVEVEVDLACGLPIFTIVGLPDPTVRESRDRVRSALRNSGFSFPQRKVTINLAPADLRKEGAGFDLPMAVGILAAEGLVPPEVAKEYVIVGEMSLEGGIRPIHGVLSMALACRRKSVKGLLVPAENAAEAAIVEDVPVYAVSSLPQVVEHLTGACVIPRTKSAVGSDSFSQTGLTDFAEVRGQQHAKRALEVAAAGGHNILLIGPPGSGKTMLAQRLPGILPPMSFEEAVDSTRIHSVAGTLPSDRPLLTARPFRSPHHTISDAGLIGGGTVPTPGEISLAHNGVLFLDELPEYKRNVLESMRQPLEDGTVSITRVAAALTYPARVMLIAAMNPCPCGFLGDRIKPCICSAYQIQRYRAKISGPLLDRLDLHIEVPAVPFRDLTADGRGEESAAIRERVIAARALQYKRYEGSKTHNNSQLRPMQLRKFCGIDPPGRALIEQAVARLGLSARAYMRILKVARTIADLARKESIAAEHVAEAIQYRSLDRRLP